MTRLIDRIATEIGKNRDEAQDFVFEIRNILGSPVDLDQILSVLQEIKRHGKRVTTPQIVAVYFDSTLPSPPKKLKEKHLSHQDEAELEEIFLSRDILEQSNLDTTPRIIPSSLQSLQQESSQQPHLKPIPSQPPQKQWKEEKFLPKQIGTELEEIFLSQDSLQQSTLDTPHINPPSLQSLQQKKQLSSGSTSSQSLEKPQKGKKEKVTSPESLDAVSPNPPLTRQPTGKIAQIASELQVDVETANNFVIEVQRLLGKSIKFKEILNVLRQLKGSQISPDKIVSVLQSKEKPIVQKERKNSKTINIGRVISIPIETKNQKHKMLPSRRPPIFQIAEELNVNKQEAQKFMAQVDKEYGTTVAFKKVLEVLKQIDNPQSVTPQIIAALLPPRKPVVTSPPIQPTVPPPVSEKSALETTSTSLPEIKGQEVTQLSKFISVSNALIEEFDIESRQSIQSLFTQFGLWLEVDQYNLRAKDNSIFPIDSSLLNEFDRGQNYLQGLVDQAITTAEFNKLVQLVVLLNVLSFGSEIKLQPELTTKILNTIAIDMGRNGYLLRYIVQHLVEQTYPTNLVDCFVHHVLLNLYYRANVIQNQRYIAHFDDRGNPFFKVLPSQNLPTLYTFANHSIWVLMWNLSPTSLSLLLPEFGQGETWVSQVDIPNNFQTTSYQIRYTPDFTIKSLIQSCFADLQNKRRYQVPSQGRAEIMTSDRLKNMIGLNLIRFVQEDTEPPNVFLRFEFGLQKSTIGLVKINKDGKTEGFHKFFWLNNSFRAITEAIALTYYRDLVTPGKIYYYQPGNRGPKQYRSSLSTKPGILPRPQHIPLHVQDNFRLKGRSFHHLYTWHEATERARHGVVGHIRKIGFGFTASPEKQEQAREAGVKLEPGYTWVIEHERGGPGSGGLRLSPEGRLLERTLFLPPERASADLDKLLS